MKFRIRYEFKTCEGSLREQSDETFGFINMQFLKKYSGSQKVRWVGCKIFFVTYWSSILIWSLFKKHFLFSKRLFINRGEETT